MTTPLKANNPPADALRVARVNPLPVKIGLRASFTMRWFGLRQNIACQMARYRA